MTLTPRQKFTQYVRGQYTDERIVSPFLPDAPEIQAALRFEGLPVSGDSIKDEITLSRHLGYVPMFMSEMGTLIFDWQPDESRSTATTQFSVLETPLGQWVREFPQGEVQWNDEALCPVQTEADHRYFVAVCEQVGAKEARIREYFRDFRRRVGEDGVIVLGHPHPSWLAYQISPAMIYYHWLDYQKTFRRSMDALFEAALFVMQIAVDEGVDFMSDSSYGLEMTSPELFREMDLPYIQAFAKWTHERDGLFWYHNCGFTRQFIMDGTFNELGADVIETIAPPPEGDNDLAESRTRLAPLICSKGNFPLTLLRDGTPEAIKTRTNELCHAVAGWKHIVSTADGVLPGTPPENLLAFLKTALAFDQ